MSERPERFQVPPQFCARDSSVVRTGKGSSSQAGIASLWPVTGRMIPDERAGSYTAMILRSVLNGRNLPR